MNFRIKSRSPYELRSGELPSEWLVEAAPELHGMDQNAAYRMMIYQRHQRRGLMPMSVLSARQTSWLALVLMLLPALLIWMSASLIWSRLSFIWSMPPPGQTLLNIWLALPRWVPWIIRNIGVLLLANLLLVQIIAILPVAFGLLETSQAWQFLGPGSMRKAVFLEAVGLTAKRHGDEKIMQPIRDLQLSGLDGRDLAVAMWGTGLMAGPRNYIFFWLAFEFLASLLGVAAAMAFAMPLGGIVPVVFLFFCAVEFATWSAPYTTLRRAGGVARTLRIMISDVVGLRMRLLAALLGVLIVLLTPFVLDLVVSETTLLNWLWHIELSDVAIGRIAAVAALGGLAVGILQQWDGRRRREVILRQMADDLDRIFDSYRLWD